MLMPQQIPETQYQYRPVKPQPQQPPRYGGGGGGGGERRGGGSDFSPEEVSQIFDLLQKASDKYFRKESRQPIPEEAIRELHRVVFSVIRKSTGEKDRLLKILQEIVEQASAEQDNRGTELTSEQMEGALRRAIERIKKCFLPIYPDE
jgi:hypothetical protein